MKNTSIFFEKGKKIFENKYRDMKKEKKFMKKE